MDEELFPILHVMDGLDELRMEARLSCDGALAAGRNCGAGARALGKVLGKLGMPDSCRLSDRSLCSHSFLDCPAPIVTLVRLHWSPLR